MLYFLRHFNSIWSAGLNNPGLPPARAARQVHVYDCSGYRACTPTLPAQCTFKWLLIHVLFFLLVRNNHSLTQIHTTSHTRAPSCCCCNVKGTSTVKIKGYTCSPNTLGCWKQSAIPWCQTLVGTHNNNPILMVVLLSTTVMSSSSPAPTKATPLCSGRDSYGGGELRGGAEGTKGEVEGRFHLYTFVFHCCWQGSFVTGEWGVGDQEACWDWDRLRQSDSYLCCCLHSSWTNHDDLNSIKWAL